jgi:hypothetical protein
MFRCLSFALIYTCCIRLSGTTVYKISFSQVLVKSKVGEGEEVTYGGQTIPCSKTDMVCLAILLEPAAGFVNVFESIL